VVQITGYIIDILFHAKEKILYLGPIWSIVQHIQYDFFDHCGIF